MAGEIALKMDSDLSRHPFNPSIYRKSVKICASSLFQVGKYEGKLALSCPATQ